MNNNITLNYLTRLTGSYPKGGAVQRPATQSERFLDTVSRMETEQTAPADTVSNTGDMTLEEYKQSIWQKISALPMSASSQMESISIHITDEGFEAMKDDPKYEAWVLDTLAKNFSFQNPWTAMCGGGYSVHHFGATKEEYHGEGWYPGYLGGKGEALFEEKSQGGFWEQRMERHKENMELSQKAADQRRMMQLRMSGGTVGIAELLMDLF